MKNRSAGTALTLLSPLEVWDRLDPLAPDLGAEPSVSGLGALPYTQLLGPGFERLCYELLVAEGHSPRFFGSRGQRDYGVDIVVETEKRRTVYQCKNLANVPSWTDVRDAVTKFESDWLEEAGLSHPDAFVYCCPQPLDDAKLGETWIRFKDVFKKQTGVNIDFWDKHALDTRLHRRPDIVAGLFSDSYAEHFCNRDDWLHAPWTRLRWGYARYAPIVRFLDRHRNAAIHVAEPDEERFQEILSGSSILAIRGLPGAGKTIIGLELACRLRAPLRRIYYATFRDSPDPYLLWKSVSRGCSLPAVLLLDDCHLNLEQTGIVLQRLRPELSDPQGVVKLLLVLRALPGSASGQVVDTPDWLVQLEQDGLIMDMKTDLARTRAVTVHLRPELTGLSGQRLERLHNLSGGDLLLLDETLSDVDSPQDLDSIRPHRLYDVLRARYFGGNRQLPTVKRLAILAQFELTPLASFLDDGWQADEKTLVTPLMTELFVPPRYQFLHSSLAELVLRALLALEVEPKRIEDAVVSTTFSELITYFRHLATVSEGDVSRDSAFLQSMEILMHTRLKMGELAADAQMKARVLNEEFIRDCIEKHLHDCSFNFLHACLVVLASASHPAKERYASFIERRFHILFENARSGYDIAGLATFSTGFMTLARNAPASLAVVQDTYGAGRFLRLIAANGTLFELFHILRHTSPTFREALLEQLDEASAGELVNKTIAAGRSIGTLNLTLRELGIADEVSLERLEQTIGAGRFLRLIAANGTLFELFHILQYVSPSFRKALLEQLDEAIAGELVNKTIAAGRSIESLHHTLEHLHQHPDHLERLEGLLGIDGWWRLFIGTGTLNSLTQITRAMSGEFRKEMLKASSGLSVADWREIVAHGLFLNACTFAREELATYSERSRAAFLQALSKSAAPLAAEATWFDLNPSRLPTDLNSPERQILQAALRPRIDGLKPEDLQDLEFRELVNGLSFAWRERPDLRPALASRLLEILPERADWPQEDGKVACLSLILPIVRSELVAVKDALRFLEEIHAFLTFSACAGIPTMPLFYLLWNICAVHYERGDRSSPSFEGALPDSLVQTLLEVLRQRVAPKGSNEEKLAQLAIAGLINFLVPLLTREVRSILAPLTKIIKWLYSEAIELSFIPALFSLEGIDLMKPSKQVFTPFVCAGLLIKSKENEDIGPAIEFLRQHVDQRVNLR